MSEPETAADPVPAEGPEAPGTQDAEAAEPTRFGGLAGLDDLAGALEALLFVSDAPVRASALSEAIGAPVDAVDEALELLRQRLRLDGSGVVLREVAGGWRLFTNPVYHHLVERYVVSWDTRKLSQAALETLAVVAYLQPVTRAQVASVRGVNSDSPISSLVEKGLVREVGTADTPGNPGLYGTTKTFLERFGLAGTADLPPLELYAPDEETRRLIRERLSGTPRGEADVSDAAVSTVSEASGERERAPLARDGAEAGAIVGAGGSLRGGEGGSAAPRFGDGRDEPGPAGFDVLAGYVFAEEDEVFEVAVGQGVSGRMLAEALTSGFGLTEKVSSDSVPEGLKLVFEEPDDGDEEL